MDVARLARRFASGGGWSEIRRVFPSWSVEIPPSFEETFVEQDMYWHAWDEARSVSLTSMTIADERGRPVSADAIEERMRPLLSGDPVAEVPLGLIAWATTDAAPASAKASQVLQGVVATRGRVLLVTVTSDDLVWARGVWLSIRHYPPTRSD